MLQAIAGHDPKDSFSAKTEPEDYARYLNSGIRGMRLGFPQEWLDGAYGITEEVKAVFNAAVSTLKELGAEIVPVECDAMMKSRAAGNLMLLSEAYAYHEADYQVRPQDFGNSVKSRMREGAFITATDYVQAQRARAVMVRKIREAMSGVDAVVMPAGTTPATPFKNQDPEAMYRNPNLLMPGNLAGLPSLSVPAGFSPMGLPVGLQVLGHAFEDAKVLGIANAYQQATDWHTRHPNLDNLS
jgi:aspartyl-tRNA(Asn)/glutamyl-tRNA(Gln) amidotransferase subunit A